LVIGEESGEQLVIGHLPLLDEKAAGVEHHLDTPLVVDVSYVVMRAAIAEERREDASLEGAALPAFPLPQADQVFQVVRGVRERRDERHRSEREDRDLPLDQRPRTAGVAASARLGEPGRSVELVGGQLRRARQPEQPNAACPTSVQHRPDQPGADTTTTEGRLGGDLLNGSDPVAALVEADEPNDPGSYLGDEKFALLQAFEIGVPRVEPEFVAV
jgi:hypothetical protein